MSSYDILHWLKWTPTQISIFELLDSSPLHKEILEKALWMVNVPNDIDPDRLQAMVNHISSPHYLSFFEEDEKSLSHPHNLALHIKFQIYNTRVHRILIDNDVGLNIVSFHVV